jgi:hypothetical protein
MSRFKKSTGSSDSRNPSARNRNNVRDRGRSGSGLHTKGSQASLPARIVGAANTSRVFDSSTYLGSPFVIYRNILPYAGFTQGWNDTNDFLGALAHGVLMDNTTVDPTTAVYPMTPAARLFTSQVFPVLREVVTMGVGTKPAAASLYTFARYIARVIEAYSVLRLLMSYNYAYNMDYSKLYPGTGDVPDCVISMAQLLDCNDNGMRDRWEPYMKRLAPHLIFPNVAAKIRKLMDPKIMPLRGARMTLPCYSMFFSGDALNSSALTALETKLSGDISYIEDYLYTQRALLTSFIPFTLMNTDGFAPPNLEYDPVFENAFFNSGVRDTYTFGDTATSGVMPDTSMHDRYSDVAGDLNGDTILFQTIFEQPRSDELEYHTAFSKRSPTAFDCVSMHLMTFLAFIDDKSVVTIFEGTGALSGAQIVYDSFANVKYRDNVVTNGHRSPERLTASIPYQTYQNELQLNMHNDFSTNILRQAIAMAAGSAVRDIRNNVLSMYQAAFESKG